MMVINDFDKTIKSIEKIDSGLCECRRLQQEIAINPEKFDSLQSYFLAPAITWHAEEFSETVEKIFSTSIETFSTIGDVNFVNLVSDFYLARSKYKKEVMDTLRKEVTMTMIQSLKSLMSVNFPEYAFLNKTFLEGMRDYRDSCMHMMNISEEDIIEFRKQQGSKDINPNKVTRDEDLSKEFEKYNTTLEQAREKLKY